MRLLLRSIPIVFVIPVLLMAQAALAGKWQGKTGGSGQVVVLDVMVKDAMLEGTLTINKETSKIADGKLSKNAFTFKATIDGRQDETFNGEIGDEQLRLWPESLGRERAVILTRIEAK